MSKSAADYFKNPLERKLAEAAAAGQSDVVKRLVTEGVSPNARGVQGLTPLLWAMQADSFGGALALLESGADPNMAADNTKSPLTLAARGKKTRYLKLLLDHGGNPSLYERDPDPDFVGDPATFVAVQHNCIDCLRMLLDAGADINAVDSNGSTLLNYLAAVNELFLMEEILNRGADPMIVDNFDGSVAWELQERKNLTPDAEKQRVKLIDMLKAKGVRFPVKGPDGK